MPARSHRRAPRWLEKLLSRRKPRTANEELDAFPSDCVLAALNPKEAFKLIHDLHEARITAAESAYIANRVSYLGMREALDKENHGKWALLDGGEVAGIFDTYASANDEACKQRGIGKAFIRRIGVADLY